MNNSKQTKRILCVAVSAIPPGFTKPLQVYYSEFDVTGKPDAENAAHEMWASTDKQIVTITTKEVDEDDDDEPQCSKCDTKVELEECRNCGDLICEECRYSPEDYACGTTYACDACQSDDDEETESDDE